MKLASFFKIKKIIIALCMQNKNKGPIAIAVPAHKYFSCSGCQYLKTTVEQKPSRPVTVNTCRLSNRVISKWRGKLEIPKWCGYSEMIKGNGK